MTALQGPGATPEPPPQNQTYVGHRLLFGNVELPLGETMSWRHFSSVSLVGLLAGLAVSLVGFVLATLIALATHSSGAFLVICALFSLAALAAFLIPWFIPSTVPVSEWSWVLDGQAHAAESAYSRIYSTFSARNLPVTVRPIRLTLDSGATGNYLRISVVRDHVYLSVFAYGSDLFVGWMLWREDRPATAVFRSISHLLRRVGDLQRQLHANETRALRDAVHNAVREAVETAAGQDFLTVAEAFGHELPIQNDPGVAAKLIAGDANSNPPLPIRPPRAH